MVDNKIKRLCETHVYCIMQAFIKAIILASLDRASVHRDAPKAKIVYYAYARP